PSHYRRSQQGPRFTSTTDRSVSPWESRQSMKGERPAPQTITNLSMTIGDDRIGETQIGQPEGGDRRPGRGIQTTRVAGPVESNSTINHIRPNEPADPGSATGSGGFEALLAPQLRGSGINVDRRRVLGDGRSTVAPPVAEAEEATTRRAVNSMAPTSPAAFPKLVRKSAEVFDESKSGNPGRSASPIQVRKPRSARKPHTGQETQVGQHA
ncbi:hypothetical protein U1Q18_010115, partial [Sarracenia purpurea var. burkii]